jgi:hypothetical protein
MRLPWRSRVEVEPVKEVPPEPPRPKTEIYASPGLEEAVRTVPDDATCKVLDLGPSVAANVDFVSKFASYLQIVDAIDREPAASEGGPAGTDRLSNLATLIESHRRSFDLVLAWDVINYLSMDQAERLVASLAELCLPNARFHAIFFASDTMPAIPNRYRIINDARLAYEAVTTEVRGAPELPPAAVAKLLKRFQVEHSFVLQHGVHEYVARRKRWYPKK